MSADLSKLNARGLTFAIGYLSKSRDQVVVDAVAEAAAAAAQHPEYLNPEEQS